MTVVEEVAGATRELLRLAGGEDALVTRLAATAVAVAALWRPYRRLGIGA